MENEKEKEGLILIELLIAMAIFAIGITTIFSLFISATQGVNIGLEKTRGLFLSTEALEAAFSISKQDLDYLTPGKYEVGINSNNQWTLIPKTGLMGHFLLSNNAKDSSIYKNQAIIQQVSFFEDRKGQSLAAAMFNGEINSYIKTEYAFSLQVEGPLTLSAWVLDTSVEKNRRTIAGKYNLQEGDGGYILYKEGDNYSFMISGQGGTASVSVPSNNLPWEYVVGVYDPGNQNMRLYINGELKEPPGGTSITSINKVPYVEFFIGNDASGLNPWHGRISDVRVYNRSLTANEISGLYNSYSASYEKSLVVLDTDMEKLVGIWSFNEGEGCVVHDNSGNNNHGIIKYCSPTQWVKNRYEKEGRAFNSENNNYIEIADSLTLQIKNEISISLWLKMPVELPTEDMTLLHKRAAGSEDFSFSLIYQGAEKGYVWVASIGLPENFSGVKLKNAAIPNKWQHIVVTFNNAAWKMYIDDNEIIDLISSTIGNVGSNSHLFIGRNAADQFPLSGVAIDDLRIYNKILTPAEIETIFLNNINYYLE